MPYFTGYGQVNSQYIINYSPLINRSGDAIYAITSDREGVLYFAVARGVLIYDGEEWEMQSVNGIGDIRSLTYDSIQERVYVGGIGTFGYLEKDTNLRYRYQELSESVLATHPFKQIWQIVVIDDSVYFIASENTYVYAHDSVRVRSTKEAFIYKSGNTVYVSQTNGPLMTQRQDSLTVIWDQKTVHGQAAFNVLSLDPHHDLIIYPTEGVYLRDLDTGEISPYRQPLSQLLKSYQYYCSEDLSKDLMAVGTWAKGILVTTLRGDLVNAFSSADGLASDGIYDLEQDRLGNLWVATEFGIAYVNAQSALAGRMKFVARPAPKIVSVSLGLDTPYFPKSNNEVLHLDHQLEWLSINYTVPGFEYFADHSYSYQLEGIDSSWTETSLHKINYSLPLKNGTYVFRVKAKVGDKESSTAQITFVINEPWYTAFKGTGGYALGGSSLIILVSLGVLRRYRHNQKELTQLVNEKTREIEEKQQELLLTNRNLVEINEELDTFLYRSSHDLVSPVKSIKGLIQLMKMSRDNDGEYLPLLEERIIKLEQLLNEINTYVKSIKRDPVIAPIRLEEMVREVWTQLEFMDNARQLELVVDIDPSFTIHSDRNSWWIILSNLLSNAIKYSDVEKSEPRIVVMATGDAKRVTFTIEDNGQGIPEAFQNKVFEMFYRAHETSSGSGLGLFLVRKTLDRIEGEIKISSEFGKGTKVIVTVPLPSTTAIS